MLLTDVQCRNATCPQGKQRKRLNDGDGLYLEITPSSKRWFFRFYSPGKDSRVAIGPYPKVGLSAARKAKDEAKAQQSQGKDPASFGMRLEYPVVTAIFTNRSQPLVEIFQQTLAAW